MCEDVCLKAKDSMGISSALRHALENITDWRRLAQVRRFFFGFVLFRNTIFEEQRELNSHDAHYGKTNRLLGR